jgi:hypothetical protein
MAPNQDAALDMIEEPSTEQFSSSTDSNHNKTRVLAFEDALKEIGERRYEKVKKLC